MENFHEPLADFSFCISAVAHGENIISLEVLGCLASVYNAVKSKKKSKNQKESFHYNALQYDVLYKHTQHDIRMMTSKQSPEPQTSSTIKPSEIENFTKDAHLWWDETGPFKPLHEINPTRLDFIVREIKGHFQLTGNAEPLKKLRILDIGCGGGLICEPLARLGGAVTGIDAGAENIAVAQGHSQAQGLKITYEVNSPESYESKPFDVVIALEVIEHVDQVETFLSSCLGHLKPGGLLIMSTLNRTPKSFALGIVAAEYILRWVPKGTHTWSQFVKPSELSKSLRGLGCAPVSLQGLVYRPFSRTWSLSSDVDVNYMMSFTH